MAIKVHIEETGFLKTEKAVKKAVQLIRRGLQKDDVIRSLKAADLPVSPEDIYEIGRNRIKARKKFSTGSKLFFDELGLRYSTPEAVADYRARRLRCRVIADVSCGVGGQLLFFARYCRKVYGVEINAKRAIIAALNARAMKANIQIILGDSLSDDVHNLLKDSEVIFSDPARPSIEKVRTVDNLEPNPGKIVERYKDITEKFAFELPPQMPPERVNKWLNGEKEYTSLDFKLNRLALYMDGLARCDVSAVSLPSEERVTDQDEAVNIESTSRIRSFIYEVDPAVVKAGLLRNLIGRLGFEAEILNEDKRRTLLTSDDKQDSAFLRKYKVRQITNFSAESIKQALRDIGAGKVTLRFSLPPFKYWDLRRELENGLKGDRWVHLFRVGERAILAERQ